MPLGIRDVDVLMKLDQGGYQNQLYPTTKVKDVLITDTKTLESWVKSQESINADVAAFMKKLKDVQPGAQVNQDAFGSLVVGGDEIIASNPTDSLELVPGNYVSLSVSNNKIIITVIPPEIPHVSETVDGLMYSTDYVKLKGIEEGANKYVHPKSGVTEGNYVAVNVNENGHVTSGTAGPLPVGLGGTGFTSESEFIAFIKKNADKPIEIIDSVAEGANNPVSSKGLYNEFQKYALKNHGNHVPKSTGSSTKFLKDGNTWSELPTATSSVSGVTTLNQTSDSDEYSAATPKLVHDKIDNMKSSLISGAATYQTFYSIENWIATHIEDFTNLSNTVTTNYNSSIAYTDNQISKLIGGASTSFDTLKEIESWVEEHQDLYDALIQTIADNKVDAHNYADQKKSEIIGTAKTYTNLGAVETWITNLTSNTLPTFVTKEDGKSLSTNDLTDERLSQLNAAYQHSNMMHSPANAERNTIISITRNGSNVDIDSNRNVNIVVPTKVSQLENDNKYLTVHPEVSATDNSSSSSILPDGGSFNVITSLFRDTFQHVTGYQTTTFTLPQLPTNLPTIGTLTQRVTNGKGITMDLSWNGSESATRVYTIGKYLKLSVENNNATIDVDIPLATGNNEGLMTSNQVSKLDGIEDGANKYILPTAGSTLGGVRTTSTVSELNGYTPTPIVGGVPYYKDTNTTYTLESFGVNATATELNYAKGVTSPIQTQLDSKSPTTHTHPTMTGASSSTDGAMGFVPKPYKADVGLYLRGDGTWATPRNDVYTLPMATSNALGGVKTSTADNKVSVDVLGVMQLNAITTDILKNGTKTLILDAGGA
nr:MAG TPA: hypothetical protein [Caudoviricetes sp.]